MKKTLLLLLLSCLGWSVAQAQLPNGSIAPDFTATDINGVSYNLYDLLDQGKTVYLDISATWCGPCWSYHNTHAFKNLWEQKGPPGTNEAFLFMIEGDGATNTACLYGPSGCVGGTQGDWVDGTPYPIIDDAGIASLYAITYFPTIYCICPADKKVYVAGQQSATGLWNFRASKCPNPEVQMVINNVQDVRCHNTNTGAIDITPTNGTAPYVYNWSNGTHTQDLVNIPAGVYTCTITSANGWTGVTPPITVSNPPAPLALAFTSTSPVGCNGILGSATAEATGGWGNYSYVWSGGQTGETVSNLTPGTYRVTATDNKGCTKSLTLSMAPPVNPTVSIAAPGTITCTQASIQLDASNSSTGQNFTYQWFASGGGNIVSGATTLTPIVNAGGTYLLRIINSENTCQTTGSTAVQANVALPTANAGAPATITCAVQSATLQGSGSSGANFIYLWTASGGGNIAGGGNTLTPLVNAGGTYQLRVTNSANGCTNTSSTTVTANNVPPSLSTVNGLLNCLNGTATLTTSTNAATPSFAWTGPNGYTSTEQSPTVNASGSYAVVVTAPSTGCTNTAVSTVTSNTTPPGAAATGGALTCVVSQVTLGGSSPAAQASYAWTGPNGYTSTEQNPTVATEGAYSLLVTDTGNGCTSSAAASVNLNNTAPTAAASTPGNLNCNNAQLQLNGANSSQGTNFTYAWTTPNGNIVEGGNTLTPLINQVGDYNLLVSNTENGCTATATTSVAQTPAVTSSISAQTNVACNGAANGSATVTPGGGTNTYSYAWSNGATTASVNDLAAGTYGVTITDGENCTASSSAVITQPDVLTTNASATAQTANGINDGTATAAPAGGSTGYAYAWSNSGTTATITDLAPGSYTVTVTDANACTAVAIVTVNSFNCALAASATSTNISCFGANNGTASVELTGAAMPVTYAWSNGGVTQSISNLAAGAYTVSVTDGNNCPATLNVSVAEPAVLNTNASATNETAAGANNGSASAAPTGGIGTYTYAWSNNATTQSISNLAPGTYSVVVTDANGCTSGQTVVVNAFNCVISAQSNVTHVSCAGALNGSIALSQTGGTAPFTYAWSNGGNTATISNLAPGTYTASISDVNGCQVLASATVTEPAPYSAWTLQTTNPACPNEATGTASASISGGTAPLNFLWSNGATTSDISNLSAGTYGLTVTDANGCHTNTSAIITATDNVPPTVSAQNATVNLDANGLAEVTLASVSAQFADNCAIATVVIAPTSFDCSQVGSHNVTVTVTDQAGLIATATAVVTIADNIAPSLTCPTNFRVCPSDNVVSYPAPVASDNCSLVNGKWAQTSGLPSGAAFPVGVTTQTYTYTDAGNNTGACSFDVEVTSPVSFDKVLVTNATNNQSNGAIDLSISGGTAPYIYVWTNAAGQTVGTTPSISDLPAGLYTVKVTDANGCVFGQQDIEVKAVTFTVEPSWLSGVRMQPNPTADVTRIVFAEIPAATLEITVIDATGRIVLTNISDGQAVITLDCAELPGGLYSVRFRTQTEAGVRKLVVSK